jgi:hypothetical protein
LSLTPPKPRTSTENASSPAPDPAVDAAAGESPDYSHTWKVAADIDVDDAGAKLATMRRFHIVKAGTKTKALDVYCGGPKGCRRSWEDAADTECEAKKNNEHLIGGDQAHRAKRKKVVIPDNATLVEGPKIQRRGIEAVVNGEA